MLTSPTEKTERARHCLAGAQHGQEERTGQTQTRALCPACTRPPSAPSLQPNGLSLTPLPTPGHVNKSRGSALLLQLSSSSVLLPEAIRM